MAQATLVSMKVKENVIVKYQEEGSVKLEIHGDQHGEAQVDPSLMQEMFLQWTPHDPTREGRVTKLWLLFECITMSLCLEGQNQ